MKVTEFDVDTPELFGAVVFLASASVATLWKDVGLADLSEDADVIRRAARECVDTWRGNDETVENIDWEGDVVESAIRGFHARITASLSPERVARLEQWIKWLFDVSYDERRAMRNWSLFWRDVEGEASGKFRDLARGDLEPTLDRIFSVLSPGGESDEEMELLSLLGDQRTALATLEDAAMRAAIKIWWREHVARGLSDAERAEVISRVRELVRASVDGVGLEVEEVEALVESIGAPE